MKETNSTNQSINQTQPTNLSQQALQQLQKATKTVEAINEKKAKQILNEDIYFLSDDYLAALAGILDFSSTVSGKIYKSFSKERADSLSYNPFLLPTAITNSTTDSTTEAFTNSLTESRRRRGMSFRNPTSFPVHSKSDYLYRITLIKEITELLKQINNTYPNYDSLPDNILSDFSYFFLDMSYNDKIKSLIDNLLKNKEKEDIKPIMEATVTNYFTYIPYTSRLAETNTPSVPSEIILSYTTNKADMIKLKAKKKEEGYKPEPALSINPFECTRPLSHTKFDKHNSFRITYAFLSGLNTIEEKDKLSKKEIEQNDRNILKLIGSTSTNKEEIEDNLKVIEQLSSVYIDFLTEVINFNSLFCIKEKSDTDTSRIYATSSTGNVVTSFEPYYFGYDCASSTITSTITSTTTY